MIKDLNQILYIKSRHHLYFSFEFILLSNLLIVNVSFAHFCIEQFFNRKSTRKLNLLCTFYFKIKDFDNLMKFWKHLQYKHNETSEKTRFQKIRRTIVVYKSYWEKHNDENKRNTNIKKKFVKLRKKTLIEAKCVLENFVNNCEY